MMKFLPTMPKNTEINGFNGRDIGVRVALLMEQSSGP